MSHLENHLISLGFNWCILHTRKKVKFCNNATKIFFNEKKNYVMVKELRYRITYTKILNLHDMYSSESGIVFCFYLYDSNVALRRRQWVCSTWWGSFPKTTPSPRSVSIWRCRSVDRPNIWCSSSICQSRSIKWINFIKKLAFLNELMMTS